LEEILVLFVNKNYQCLHCSDELFVFGKEINAERYFIKSMDDFP